MGMPSRFQDLSAKASRKDNKAPKKWKHVSSVKMWKNTINHIWEPKIDNGATFCAKVTQVQ